MSVEENGSRVESSREDHTGTSTFDSAARGLADGSVSRGKALRMLAASLFGGALVAAPAAVAVAAPSDKRKPGGTGCPVAGQIRQGGKCTCPQGTTECGTGSNAQCVNRECGTGSTFNPETCQCEAVNTCGAGEVLCGGNCLQECGGAQVRNPESCACECPGSEELCNGRCVDPTGCSATSTFNPETCRCEANNQCGENQVLCGGQCLSECSGGQIRLSDCKCGCPSTACSVTGQTRNPQSCACECPATQPIVCGGACRAECPSGQLRDPVTCNCVANATCGPTTCEGCCDSSGSGVCRAGTTTTNCGPANGGVCQTCPAGYICTTSTRTGVRGCCINSSSSTAPTCTSSAQCCSGRVCQRVGGTTANPILRCVDDD